VEAGASLGCLSPFLRKGARIRRREPAASTGGWGRRRWWPRGDGEGGSDQAEVASGEHRRMVLNC
jgi:hypothetical protein